MPIFFDDLTKEVAEAVSAKKTAKITPAFFSSKLNGNGKAANGLFHAGLSLACGVSTEDDGVPSSVKRTRSSDGVTLTNVPMGILPHMAVSWCADIGIPVGLRVPDPINRFTVDLVDDTGRPITDIKALFTIIPQTMSIREDRDTDGENRRIVSLWSRMELHLVDAAVSEPGWSTVMGQLDLPSPDEGKAVTGWTWDAHSDAAGFIEDQLHGSALGCVAAGFDGLEEWLLAYPIHDRVLALAEAWASGALAEDVCQMIEAICATQNEDYAYGIIRSVLSYLENYDIPLDAYRKIHQTMVTVLDAGIVQSVSKHNLNILMNQVLGELDAARPALPVVPVPQTPPTFTVPLSIQQNAAVTTHEPLVIVQSGAGTGKSTTILQRISYLNQCDVPLSDINVLSFTNAAADHISELNPGIGSMTIAKMIVDIYSMSYPAHQLSNTDTIINSLDIFCPDDPVAADLRRLLIMVDKKDTGAVTKLNSFVEESFDSVIAVLDLIGQTSLDLQIIICYQRIGSMPEPSHIASRHLIVDEVQDTSIFEFVYLLKYVAKHQETMFIVGDASQTLYEFRAANPRALNTLEGSGIFHRFKLETNYRSNQEILDFANVILDGLETNHYAGIKLRANSLDAPTADSFQEHVKVDYISQSRTTGILQNSLIPHLRGPVVKDYVKPALSRGEQVAFLAYARSEVFAMKAMLEQVFPGEPVVSLVSQLVYSTDVFSKFVKHYWNDIRQVRPADASYAVLRGIQDNLPRLSRHGTDPRTITAVTKMISDWWLESGDLVNSWVALEGCGGIGSDEFFVRLRSCVLDFEIRRNQEKLNVSKHSNQLRKQAAIDSGAQLLVSTIHGAKGLEFDNVVLLYKEDTKMSQEDRRMYYVALTRAIKSEFVLAHGKVRNAPIVAAHKALIAALKAKDESCAADDGDDG